MPTCPKCRKQNPDDAAFCGFCGSALAQGQKSPAAPAKTVFGYNLDVSTEKPQSPAAPQPAPSVSEGIEADTVPLSPQIASAPVGPVAEDLDKTTPYNAQGEMIGGRFWQGELLKKLPLGGLYAAKDATQQIPVELLLVEPSAFPSPLDMERARRELRQLRKVESPNLVSMVEHGKTDAEQLYLVMEPVAGQALDELVQAGPLDLLQAQTIIRGIGQGLAEAQKMGVIHRDIAPHNILVTERGEAKVRGFGVAAKIKPNVFGTPEFLSPEQASGRPVDQRSNIYSLGALMYYMLTGTPPFSGDVETLLDKHLKQDPPPPSSVRPDLGIPIRAEALIMKALAKSSSRRHLTLRQFLREVDALSIEDKQAQAAPAPSPPLSFVTPVHGVTALTGGERPPSSEMRPLGGSTAPPAQPAPAGNAAASVVPTLMQARDVESAPEAVPPQAADSTTQPPTRGSSITGELSTATLLKKAEGEMAPPSPSAPVSAPPPKGEEKKAGFRETMWFFKGEVESAMAESGDDEAPAPPAEENPEELSSKYVDDGSLTEEEARRLSLRTGKTQMMQQVSVPTGHVPGRQMKAEDFIDEMNPVRKYALWVGLPLVAVTVAVVVFLLLR